MNLQSCLTVKFNEYCGRRRSSKNDTRQLSDEARRAKQLRRRLERRYRRTGLESDRHAYQAACTAARDNGHEITR